MTLVPDIYLPKRFDNPKTRDWACGMFASHDIILAGSKVNALLSITGHLEAGNSIQIRNFAGVQQVRRTASHTKTVTDSSTSKSLGGLCTKTKSTKREVTVITAEPGNTLSANNIVIEDIGLLYQQGPRIEAGTGGVSMQNIQKIQEAALKLCLPKTLKQ